MYGFSLDTLLIVRAEYSNNTQNVWPTDNKLSTLNQFYTGIELDGNHHALEDVKALYAIFCRIEIWNHRFQHLTVLKGESSVLLQLPNTNDPHMNDPHTNNPHTNNSNIMTTT